MSAKTSLPPKNITPSTSGQKGPIRAKQSPPATAAKTQTKPVVTKKPVASQNAAPKATNTPAPSAPKPRMPRVKAVSASTSAPNLSDLAKKKVSRKHGAAGVSFCIYIKKLLKHVAAEATDLPEDKKVVNISNSATSSIDQVAKVVAQSVATYARANCVESKRNIVSVTDVKFGAAITFPSGLRDVVFEGMNRIEEASERIRTENEEKAAAKTAAPTTSAKPTSHPSRREAQYGLVFSVSGVDKFIRDFKTTSLSVSNEAPVYLALFIENFVKHLLRKTVEEVRLSKKTNTKTRHIFHAIERDMLLSELFGRYNIKLYDVGVVPHIFDELIPTKEEKNARYKKRTQAKLANSEGAPASSSDGKKQKRKLPGTKALRYIKESQKDTGLLMQKAPFDRVVREHIIPLVCDELNIEYKDRSMFHFRDAMVEVIQQFVEDSAIDLINKAQQVAIHCCRNGLQGSDIELAWKLAAPAIPYLQVDPSGEGENEGAPITMHHIGNCGIEHLATRAGVVRKGATIHDVVRAFIKSALIQVLKFAIMRVHYRTAVTINDADIRFALKQMGVVYIFHREKVPKAKPASSTPVPQ